MTESNLQVAEDDILRMIRADVGNPVLLDLGCGQTTLPEGFIGLDWYSEGPGILKCDLFKEPWAPWRTLPALDINTMEEREVGPGFFRLQDESVDYLTSSHFVEHVPDWDLHFREAYRVLKPGGYYKIVGPYYMSDRYAQDPDHKQPLLAARFMYLDQDWLRYVRQEHNRAQDVHFKTVFTGYAFHADFAAGLSEETQMWHVRHTWNAVDDIAIILKKLPIPEKGSGVD